MLCLNVHEELVFLADFLAIENLTATFFKLPFYIVRFQTPIMLSQLPKSIESGDHFSDIRYQQELSRMTAAAATSVVTTTRRDVASSPVQERQVLPCKYEIEFLYQIYNPLRTTGFSM